MFHYLVSLHPQNIQMKNITNEIRARVSDLYTLWLDQITIRGHSNWGSARYNKADEKAEAIENEMSTLVFGDTAHTATEAYKEKEADEI